MKIPCPVCVPCSDPSDPTANYSTEDPDVDHFFCYGSSNGSLQPGAGYNWNVGNGNIVVPNRNGNGVVDRCNTVAGDGNRNIIVGKCNIVWGPVSCVATTAELCQSCVQQSRWSCDPNLPGPELPNIAPIVDPNCDPVQIFTNSLVACTVKCPTGESFTDTVFPGRFFARSQGLADREAIGYACNQAHILRLCLSALTQTECCVNARFTGSITATGRNVSATRNRWQVVGGSLPPGVLLNDGLLLGGPTVQISGVPTTSGQFTFRVRVTDTQGSFMEKVYTLCVIDIAPATLPDGTVGSAYSQTLTATACAAPALSWQVSAGLLPPGLTLDETTGNISGTPTSAGSYAFRIILQTQAT